MSTIPHLLFVFYKLKEDDLELAYPKVRFYIKHPLDAQLMIEANQRLPGLYHTNFWGRVQSVADGSPGP